MKKAPKVNSKHLGELYGANELRWPLYDSYHASIECQLARSSRTVSVLPSQIDKYALQATQTRKENDRLAVEAAIPKLPEVIASLVRLQGSDGSWPDLDAVRRCLGLADGAALSEGSHSQQATAISLVTIRQQVSLFDLVHGAHDRGLFWLERSFGTNTPSQTCVFDTSVAVSSILQMARDLVDSTHFEGSVSESTSRTEVPQTVADASAERKQTPPHQQLRNEESLLHLKSDALKRLEAISISLRPTHRPSAFPAISPLKPLGSQSFQSTSSMTEEAAKKYSYHVAAADALNVKLVSLYIEIEGLVSRIYECKDACVKAFHQAETVVVKNAQFDELNYRLGDGFKAPSLPTLGRSVSGLPKWKAVGVPGLRPKIVQFFTMLADLAEERLEAEEWRTYYKKEAMAESACLMPQISNARWQLRWNGEDLVHNVMHCLDGLRQCRELRDWYGRGLRMLCNPLMLSFDLATAISQLGMNAPARMHISSAPHARKHSPVTLSDPETRYQLDRWRDAFEDLCYRHKLPNAPQRPDLESDQAARDMYVTLLTIAIAYGDEALKSASRYEERFLLLASTAGGESLLEGKSAAQKPHKFVHVSINTSRSLQTSDSAVGSKSSKQRRKGSKDL